MKRYLLIGLGGLVGLILIVSLVGSFLPEGHSATSQIVLTVPRDSVWAVVTNFAEHPTWRSRVERMVPEVTAEGDTVWVEHSGTGPLPYRVTERVPPSRLVTRMEDGLPFGGTWTYQLNATDSLHTEVRITEDGLVYNPVFRFVSLFLSQHATMDGYLTDLAARYGQTVEVEHL